MMYALLGLGLFCAAILLIGCFSTLRDRENSPRWVKAKWVVQLLFYTAFAGLIFGAAILGNAIVHAASYDYGWLEVALAVLILGATAVTWRVVRRPLPSDPGNDAQHVGSGLEQATDGAPAVPDKRNVSHVNRRPPGRTRRSSAA